MPSTPEIASGTDAEIFSAPVCTFSAAPLSPSHESSSDARSCSTSRRKILEKVPNRADERHQEQQPDQRAPARSAEHHHRRRQPARHLRLRHQVPQGVLEHERQEDPDEHDQEGVADRRERREHTGRRGNQQHRSHRQEQLDAPRLTCVHFETPSRVEDQEFPSRNDWLRGVGFPHTDGVNSRRRHGSSSLERLLDVVAERERDLRGARDDSRGARHRRHRLEGGDDLVARCSGCRASATACWNEAGRRIDGDRRGDAHERRGPLVEG